MSWRVGAVSRRTYTPDCLPLLRRAQQRQVRQPGLLQGSQKQQQTASSRRFKSRFSSAVAGENTWWKAMLPQAIVRTMASDSFIVVLINEPMFDGSLLSTQEYVNHQVEY